MARLITSITLDPFALLEALTPIVFRFKQKTTKIANVWMGNSDKFLVNFSSWCPKRVKNHQCLRVVTIKKVSKQESKTLKVEISDGFSELLRDELTEILNQLGAEVVG